MLLPEISLPTAKEIFDLACLNSSLSMISRSVTMLIFSFSTSIPTAALPGIGASILMLFALKLSAISSARALMLFTLTPVLG